MARRVGLERVAAAGSILEAIRVTPLAVAEMQATGNSSSAARSVVPSLMNAIRDEADAVTAIAAVHALAAFPGRHSGRALADVMGSGAGPLPAHAAWASAGRAPAAELLEPLVDLVVGGHLAGLHAQTALAQWARTEPWLIAAALRRGLAASDREDGRRNLVETLGLVPDDCVLPDLGAVAADGSEKDAVRVAAIAALGDRLTRPIPRSISALARGDGRVADAVRLAEFDRGTRGSSSVPAGRGVRVAQVHLGAVLDPNLLRSGMGDTGGIATLLVRLGVALSQTPQVAEVITTGQMVVPKALSEAGFGFRYPRLEEALSQLVG